MCGAEDKVYLIQTNYRDNTDSRQYLKDLQRPDELWQQTDDLEGLWEMMPDMLGQNDPLAS